jgi:hypothetical protein
VGDAVVEVEVELVEEVDVEELEVPEVSKISF